MVITMEKPSITVGPPELSWPWYPWYAAMYARNMRSSCG
jgi:hypothetical protein